MRPDMLKPLVIATRQPLPVQVDGENYLLDFPLSAIAELELRLGRSMKTAVDWFRVESRELPAILEAGFERNHPETATELAASICDALEPEAIETVIDGLCRSLFPKAFARMVEAVERMKTDPKAGSVAAL